MTINVSRVNNEAFFNFTEMCGLLLFFKCKVYMYVNLNYSVCIGYLQSFSLLSSHN